MLPDLSGEATMTGAFNRFWDAEKTAANEKICADEGMNQNPFKSMIESYHFSGKQPLQGAIVDAMAVKPKILARKSVVERVVSKLLGLVSTFDEGIGDV